jgi:hypothetical protein
VPVPGRPSQAAVFVRIAGNALTSNGNMKTGMFSAGAVTALRVVDGAGRVVHEEATVAPIHGLMSDARSTLDKPIEFRRFLDLPPGTYTLHVAVYDQVAKHASIVSLPYSAPATSLPVVGSLMIIDHAQRLSDTDAEDPADPFIVSHVLVHPAYDPGVNRAVQPALNFLLPVLLEPGAEAPGATLALLEKGATIASVPLKLGTADATGKFMAVGRVPLDKVPPGTYQLQVTVGSGPTAAARATPLTVVE